MAPYLLVIASVDGGGEMEGYIKKNHMLAPSSVAETR
jgi:hypothetical protein